jgi:hypothetical protein
VLAFVAATTIAEYLLGTDFGIDRIFLANRINDWTASGARGRTGLPTLIAFFFAGLGLIGIRTRRGGRAANVCAAVVASVSYLGFIGYAFHLPKLYGRVMAMHTAVLLGVAALALSTLRSDSV